MCKRLDFGPILNSSLRPGKRVPIEVDRERLAEWDRNGRSEVATITPSASMKRQFMMMPRVSPMLAKVNRAVWPKVRPTGRQLIMMA